MVNPPGSLRLLAVAAVLLSALNMPVAQGQTSSAYSANLTGSHSVSPHELPLRSKFSTVDLKTGRQQRLGSMDCLNSPWAALGASWRQPLIHRLAGHSCRGQYIIYSKCCCPQAALQAPSQPL